MSGQTLVLLLGDPGHWLRIDQGHAIARGERPAPADRADERIVAIVPAHDSIVHSLALPDLTDAQARGAARIAIGETSMVPIDDLHIAVGPDKGGTRATVAIDRMVLAMHLATLAEAGFDPDAMIPAALVLPCPDIGFVRAEIGDETVLRGHDAAFADDPALTPLLVRGDVVPLDAAATEAAIVAAVAHPPLDLRQGAFAKRRNWGAESVQLRRIAWLAAACLVVVLITPIAFLINMNMAASRIEAQSIAAAQSALPPGTAVTSPVAQIEARLAESGSAGASFMALAAAAAKAVEVTPSAELGAMTFDSASGLKVTIRATAPAELAQIEARLTAAGFAVEPGPVVTSPGKAARDLTVRAR